ncbi:hypothetical protein [Brevibacillus porteri]|uniref:hypothetical protein n=2 Tax=Brevibacillus TaxID=55080 RepID=UPI000367AE86|nr:hypothetical protein A616_29630 [Brevibacillus brevis X23]
MNMCNPRTMKWVYVVLAFFLLLGNVYFPSRAIAIESTEKLVKNIEWTPKSTVIDVNKRVNLFPIENTISKEQLVYQMWVKVPNEDWELVQPYGKLPLIDFAFTKTGENYIQIDIKDLKHPENVQHWVQQFNVVEPIKDMELVEGISWAPFYVEKKVNEPIDFIIKEGKFQLSDLEFQLWGKYGEEDWKVITPYQASLATGYRFPKEGIYSLQVDVRHKKHPNYRQQVWVGQFFVSNIEREANSDYLIRRLLSNYPSPAQNAGQISESLIYELNLAIHMLMWEYHKVPLMDRVDKMRNLPGIVIGSVSNDSIVGLKIGTESREVDLSANKLMSDDQLLSISLKQYPNVKKVLDDVRNLPDDIQFLSVLTYLYSVNYMYSQVPESDLRPRIPLYSLTAHCLNLASEMHDILRLLNYNVRYQSINYFEDAFHAVIEVKVGSQIITLDPTVGLLFQDSLTSLKSSSKATPIVFPQVRDLNFLWSPGYRTNIKSINIEEAYGNW